MNNKDLINQINWMKDEEKKFFKFCCKRIDMDSISNYGDGTSQMRLYGTNFYDLVKEFHEKFDVPMNRLCYYVSKWDSLGMIDYGVNLFFGWFELGTKTPIRYVVLMPDRIYKKLRNKGVNLPI